MNALALHVINNVLHKFTRALRQPATRMDKQWVAPLNSLIGQLSAQALRIQLLAVTNGWQADKQRHCYSLFP